MYVRIFAGPFVPLRMSTTTTRQPKQINELEALAIHIKRPTCNGQQQHRVTLCRAVSACMMFFSCSTSTKLRPRTFQWRILYIHRWCTCAQSFVAPTLRLHRLHQLGLLLNCPLWPMYGEWQCIKFKTQTFINKNRGGASMWDGERFICGFCFQITFVEAHLQRSLTGCFLSSSDFRSRVWVRFRIAVNAKLTIDTIKMNVRASVSQIWASVIVVYVVGL